MIRFHTVRIRIRRYYIKTIPVCTNGNIWSDGAAPADCSMPLADITCLHGAHLKLEEVGSTSRFNISGVPADCLRKRGDIFLAHLY